MSVNKGARTTSFTVFSIIILIELFTSGDRFVSGRHLHRHSTHRHRPMISDRINAIPGYVEANELGEYKAEDPVKVVLEDSKAEEIPEEHRQAQLEDSILFPDMLRGPKTQESMVSIEGNELDHESAIEEEKDTLTKENGDDSATMVLPDGEIPEFFNRHIIDAPLIVRGCKEGERKDSRGKCRLVLMK